MLEVTGRRVGVIGLGRMGLPIARRLVEAGAHVTGFDIDPGSRRAADALGVELSDGAGQLAATTDATFVIVGFDDELRQVCLDPGGILESAAEGHVVFVCSTVKPNTVVELGDMLDVRGINLLDATLCRAEHAAHDGNLLVLCGGDEETFQRWEPAMRCFASDVLLLGGRGAGQIGKMLNNLLLWIAVVGNYEALRLGRRLGLGQETLIPALQLGSGANWALGTWDKARPMPWAEDDLDICLDYAERHGMAAPLASLVRRQIEDLKHTKATTLPDGVGSSMQAFLDALDDGTVNEPPGSTTQRPDDPDAVNA